MQVCLLALLFTVVESSRRLQWGTRTEFDLPIIPGEYESYKRELQAMIQQDKMADDYVLRHHQHHYWDTFRLTFQCPVPMIRYPAGTIDGGKFTCALNKIQKPCVIYSFGSEGNYMFEREMGKFGCAIHTFDCFGDYGTSLPTNTTFHKWCVGGVDELRGGRRFFTIPTIMKVLNHTQIDFLKMDIEGAEYESLEKLLDLPMRARPWQLAVELHQWSDVRSTAQLRQTLKLWTQLDSMDYRLVSREDNTPAPCCSEFVWVRPDAIPK